MARLRIILFGVLGVLTACQKVVEPPVSVVVEKEYRAPSPQPPGLTPAQQACKQRLVAQISADRATHRLTLRNGKTVDGRLIAESSRAIRLQEPFGYSGSITASYDRNAVRRVETLPAGEYEVTDADARFSEEFTGFHFIKAPPYSIVTDESYSEVEKIIRILGELRGQFEQHFASVINKPVDAPPVEVVFFAHENAFRECARHAAPGLVNSAGFFSHRDNRLVLLNQLGTTQYSDFRSKLDARERDHRVASEPRAQQHLAAWRSQVALEARSLNERLIRHEGAHQLFQSYRIHSDSGLEPTWLTEGLAQYCEPSQIGRRHDALVKRLATFRQAGALIPLRDLLNHRDESGFFSLGDNNVETAYAES